MIHPPPSAHLLPAWVDLVAMVVAGAFGAHVARRRHIPIAGELLAGVIVGLGGGTPRQHHRRSVRRRAGSVDWPADRHRRSASGQVRRLSAVLIGSVTFYLFTIYIGFYTAVVVTVAVVVLLRVLSVHFDWTSPVFPGDEPWSEDR